jgi:methylphosphotriester-DNA--protein-cysteine methyltransferase
MIEILQFCNSGKAVACTLCKLLHGQKGTSESVSSLANRPRPEIFPRLPRGANESVSDRPEAGSSSYHFSRLFQAYVGETPFEFLRRLRLVTALRMLQEDTDASVTEIALSVGYETSAAFNKSFRKTLEMTPNDFRNLGKEQQDEVSTISAVRDY